MVQKMSQCLYPLKQAQLMNKGWATFWRDTLLNPLYHKGRVTEQFMLVFLHSQNSMVYQPSYSSLYYVGAPGFTMFQDIYYLRNHEPIVPIWMSICVTIVA